MSCWQTVPQDSTSDGFPVVQDCTQGTWLTQWPQHNPSLPVLSQALLAPGSCCVGARGTHGGAVQLAHSLF